MVAQDALEHGDADGPVVEGTGCECRIDIRARNTSVKSAAPPAPPEATSGTWQRSRALASCGTS